jgi:hypothetical protein
LYFTANPDQITPLGSSVLKWDTVLADGAALSLDGHPVQSTGTSTVTPSVTTTYVLSVTPPRTSPEPQVSELSAEPPIPLGNATVYVDASQCVQQTQKDLQADLQFAMVAGYDDADIGGIAKYPPVVAITTGLITFDMKGTATMVVFANVEMKGSFGLTVDRAKDQLAPIIESNQVSVSLPAGTWAAGIGVGALSGGAAGWAIGGAIGGLFGAVIGVIIGGVVGGVGGVVGLNAALSKVQSSVEATLAKYFFPGLATYISSKFSEPKDMAFAQVSIAPDPSSTIGDGNVTVLFCPKLSPVTDGGRSIS